MLLVCSSLLDDGSGKRVSRLWDCVKLFPAIHITHTTRWKPDRGTTPRWRQHSERRRPPWPPSRRHDASLCSALRHARSCRSVSHETQPPARTRSPSSSSGLVTGPTHVRQPRDIMPSTANVCGIRKHRELHAGVARNISDPAKKQRVAGAEAVAVTRHRRRGGARSAAAERGFFLQSGVARADPRRMALQRPAPAVVRRLSAAARRTRRSRQRRVWRGRSRGGGEEEGENGEREQPEE